MTDWYFAGYEKKPFPVAAAAAAAPFAIDDPLFGGIGGTANSGSATNLPLPGYSTTYANDIVIVAFITNDTTGNATVSGGSLTWARVPGLTGICGTGGSVLDIWYAVAASPLSNAVFTINNSSSQFVTGLVFAVSGAKTTGTIFEGAQEQNNTSVTASITTTSSNVLGFGIDADTTSTPETGFTDMNATARGNFLQLDYKFSVSGFSSQFFSSNHAQAGSLVIAIVKAP